MIESRFRLTLCNQFIEPLACTNVNSSPVPTIPKVSTLPSIPVVGYRDERRGECETGQCRPSMRPPQQAGHSWPKWRFMMCPWAVFRQPSSGLDHSTQNLSTKERSSVRRNLRHSMWGLSIRNEDPRLNFYITQKTRDRGVRHQIRAEAQWGSQCHLDSRAFLSPLPS